MKKTRVIEEFIDDLTGESLDADKIETIVFGWAIGGRLRWLEIDLGPETAATFKAQMLEYADHARERTTELSAARSRGSSMKNRSKKEREAREHIQAVRNWARANGFTVADRGRIPREVKDAYEREYPTPEQIADANRRWKDFDHEDSDS